MLGDGRSVETPPSRESVERTVDSPAATMVYESDFYTTRRPYRPSSYSVSRRPPGDWEKVPFVPRPSLVPDPITAFGRRSRPCARGSILDPVVRQNIAPLPESKLAPLAPYVSPRDQTRARVLAAVGQRERAYEADPLGTPRDHMDVQLAYAHGRPEHLPHRHVYYSNYATY